MNTTILRLARRDTKTGIRYWKVPNAANQVRLVPAKSSFWNRPAFYFPFINTERAGGPSWEMRGYDLSRWRAHARKAALALVGREV